MSSRVTQAFEGGRRRRLPSARFVAVVAVLLLAAVGCGDGEDGPAASDGDGDGMVVEDRSGRPVDQAAPGAELQIRYPAMAGVEMADWTRGIVVVLERADGDGWRPTHRLSVGRTDPPRPPGWSGFDEDGAVEMVGLRGEGPDQIVLPPAASSGRYRLCTEFHDGPDAVRRLCAELRIGD